MLGEKGELFLTKTSKKHFWWIFGLPQPLKMPQKQKLKVNLLNFPVKL